MVSDTIGHRRGVTFYDEKQLKRSDDEILMSSMMMHENDPNFILGTTNNIYDLGCQESYLYHHHQEGFQSNQSGNNVLLFPRNGFQSDGTLVQLGPSSFVNGTMNDCEDGMNESNRNKKSEMLVREESEGKDHGVFNGCSTMVVVPRTELTFINDPSHSIHLNTSYMDTIGNQENGGSDHITHHPWNKVVGDGLMSMEGNIHEHYVTRNDGNHFDQKDHGTMDHGTQVYNYHLAPMMVSTNGDNNSVQFHDLDSSSFHSPISMEDTSTISNNGHVTVLIQPSRSGTNVASYSTNQMIFDHSTMAHLQPSSSSLSSTSSLSSSTATTRRGNDQCHMTPDSTTFALSSFHPLLHPVTIDTSYPDGGQFMPSQSQLMNTPFLFSREGGREYSAIDNGGHGSLSTIMKLLPQGSSITPSMVMNQNDQVPLDWNGKNDQNFHGTTYGKILTSQPS